MAPGCAFCHPVFPWLTSLDELVHESARLIAQRRDADLDSWVKQVREAGRSELEPFLTGREARPRSGTNRAGRRAPFDRRPWEVIEKGQVVARASVGASRAARMAG